MQGIKKSIVSSMLVLCVGMLAMNTPIQADTTSPQLIPIRCQSVKLFYDTGEAYAGAQTFECWHKKTELPST